MNKVDVDILNTALKTPYYAIFDNSAVANIWPSCTKLHQVLFDNLCPIVPGDISVFVNGTMQAAMLTAPEFYQYQIIGESQGLKDASLGRRLNMDFFANQNLPNFTVAAAPNTMTVNGAHTKNFLTEQTVTFAATGGGNLAVGNIVNIVGSGDHAITALTGTATAGTITIRPSLRADLAGGNVITLSIKSAESETDPGDTYGMGYAFHRGAIAFASRPLSTISSPHSIIRSVGDPLSGISVRLEQVRVGKSTEWQWDILYGVQLVREELTARCVDVV